MSMTKGEGTIAGKILQEMAEDRLKAIADVPAKKTDDSDYTILSNALDSLVERITQRLNDEPQDIDGLPFPKSEAQAEGMSDIRATHSEKQVREILLSELPAWMNTALSVMGRRAGIKHGKVKCNRKHVRRRKLSTKGWQCAPAMLR